MKLEKLHFEVQLVEHCNLNCNNCVHYSPIAKEEYMDVDLYRRDLSRLSMLFGGEAEWIRLLGGEPLLHPEIIRIIKLTREFFSNTYISIVTNGILLLQMPDEFYLACRDYRIAISITQYPIRIKYNDLKEKLISYEVDYTIYSFAEIRKRMCRRLIDIRGINDPSENFNNCKHANDCITLKNGKLFSCATLAHVHHLKDYFNLTYLDLDGSGLDIFRIDNANDILDGLLKPDLFCKYCDSKFQDYYEDDWCRSKKDKYEWVSFIFCEDDIQYLKEEPYKYIYGVGSWGYETLHRLEKAGVHIDGILVGSKRGIPNYVDGVEVLDINDCNLEDRDGVVLLTVNNGKEKIEAQHMLRERGFKKIIPIMKM